MCAQICFDLAHDKLDQGIAGMIAGFILARGGGIGLVAGVGLYLLLSDNQKIRQDYADNKRRQQEEDERTQKMLDEFAARREAFKAGTLQNE